MNFDAFEKLNIYKMWVDSIMSHRVFAFLFPVGVKLWSYYVRCLPVWCVSISSEAFRLTFPVNWAHNPIPFPSVHSPGQIVSSNLRSIYCCVSNTVLKMNDQDFTFLLQILKEVKCLFFWILGSFSDFYSTGVLLSVGALSPL